MSCTGLICGGNRSGTFAISLLLALPGLPSAPRTAPGDEEGEETEEEYRALNPEGVLGKSAQEIEHLSLEDKLRCAQSSLWRGGKAHTKKLTRTDTSCTFTPHVACRRAQQSTAFQSRASAAF